MKSLQKFKILITVFAFIIVSVSVSAYVMRNGESSGYTFETVKVERGSVSNTVTATGTLEATDTVIVGTQVSGVIEKLHVDFNSVVKKGQLIAELDKSTLQSSLDNEEANLYNAEAEVEYQKSNLERMKVVYEKGMLSDSAFDLAEYNYKKSEATLKSAKANVSRAERNLNYAMIYAPIDGIVLNRAVEEGQTVAASMNTPELFTITNDLSEMQVEADVDEADIGMVKEGQRVEFSVDAFPDETFSGEITEVRLQPTETSHVITYTVIITFQNPELKLKPGMTASITVYVEEVNDVLVLAGKATRFIPEPEVMKAYMKNLSEGERPQHKDGPRPDGNDERPKEDQKPEPSENMKQVWVKEDTAIKPVIVETGVTDGMTLQIVSGLSEGDEVVTAMEVSQRVAAAIEEDDDTKRSPFVQEGQGGPPRP